MIAQTNERIEFLTDILITAVEGGVNHWAQVSYYSPDGPPEKRGAFLSVDDGDTHWLGLDQIEKGVQRIVKDRSLPHLAKPVMIASICNDVCPDEPGAQDIDAGFADAIVQYALFRELVYG